MSRPRFSLRVALLAFTLIGLGLGFYGRHVVEHRRQIRLAEVARKGCEKAGCLGILGGNPNSFFQIQISSGPRLTVQAAQAIGEAQLIKQVVIWDTISDTVRATLSANFHRVEGSYLHTTWDRNGWEVPQDILDQRNGVKQ